jgi:fused signal recognition particle receptor
MFEFLKDKLKSWVRKGQEEKEEIKPEEQIKGIEERVKEKETKEDKRAKKSLKKEKKIKEKKGRKEKKREEKSEKQEKVEEAKQKEIIEKDIGQIEIEKKNIEIDKEISELRQEDLKEEKLEETKEKKKGFFSKLFNKKEKVQEIKPKLQNIGNLIWEDIKKEQEETEIREKEERKSILNSFKRKLTEDKFEEMFSELEIILLENNVAMEVVEEIKKYLKTELVGKNLSEINIQEKLKEAVSSVLLPTPNFLKEIKAGLDKKKPFVIIFVGINGSGKTTTIAKVAHMLKKNKLSVCLAAADTFRAASIEQLQKHAEKLEIPLIKKDYGSDPASVGFDAIQYAKSHGTDIVLIDTAGRMNTKDSLMKEMEKIVRVSNPDIKIFIGESLTGNDATEQARAFNDSINLNGIILSKADVDEKGGTALSVSFVTKKPILFLGTGQSYDDLETFDKEKIIKNLGL